MPLFWDFLVKWPDPESVCKGDEEDIATFLQPIGLNNRRARVIKRFTEDFLTKDWIYPKVIHQYALGFAHLHNQDFQQSKDAMR